MAIAASPLRRKRTRRPAAMDAGPEHYQRQIAITRKRCVSVRMGNDTAM